MQTSVSENERAAWSADFCKIVKQSAPGVFFFHFRGRIPTEAFAPTMIDISKAARTGRVTLVGDGADWMHYEPAYRPLWTTWLRENMSHIDAVHLLVRSPFLRMGVQVVNMVTNNVIKTYNDRSQLADVVAAKWPQLGDEVRELEHRAVRLTGQR